MQFNQEEKGSIVIKNFEGGHANHDLNQEYYKSMPKARKLNPEDAKTAVEFLKAGCSTSKVRDMMESRTGKVITTQDLQNLKARLPGSDCSKTDLEQTVQLLQLKHKEDLGSDLSIILEPKNDKCDQPTNVVKAMFWMSSSMKHLFTRFGTTLFIDGTYGLTNKGYILFPFLVEDEYGTSRFCAWCITSNEKKDVLVAALETFKNAIGNEQAKRLKYVVIDKSFVEIQALNAAFPHTTFILCKFHVLKTIRQYLTSHFKGDLAEVASTIKNNFETMVHTSNEKQYFEAWRVICGLGGSNSTINECITYLDKNWHQNRNHWAFFVLKHFNLHFNFTNNRSEGTNSLLKREISRNKNLSYLVESLFRIEKQQSSCRLLKTQYARNKTFAPTDLVNKKENELVIEASKIVGQKTVRMILSEFREVNKVDVNDLCFDAGQLTCPRLSGKCSFNENRSLPCAHLFKVKIHLGESPIVCKAMIGKEYYIHPLPVDGVKPEKQTQTQSVFKKLPKRAETAQSRYRNTKKDLEGLIENISNSDYKSRQDKTTFLNTIDDFWKEGKSLQLICNDKPIPLVEEESDDSEICPSSQQFEASLRLSPKVIRHHKTRIESQRKFKKRIKTETQNEPPIKGANEVAVINKNLKPLGLNFLWDNKSLGYLKNDEFLDDIAIGSASILIKKKFPEICGLQETWLYNSFGYNAVQTNQKFIQAIHNGTNHWLMVTNIGLPDDAKVNEVIIYDSLIKMQRNSQNIYNLNESVKLQCCQLLRGVLASHDISNIVVHIKPCQQQQNSTDCGLFCVANMLAVANGHDPGRVYYPESLRMAFLEMLKAGEMTSFLSEEKNLCNEHHFKISVQLGPVLKLVNSQNFTRIIDAICHCKLSGDLGSIIYCSNCKKPFHANCYLLPNTASISKDVIKSFLCYNCRSSISSLQLSASSSTIPDHVNIKNTADRILQIMPHVLEKLIPRVLRFEHKLSNCWDVATMQFINDITARFDLNKLSQEEGPIYNAIYTVFVNLMQELSFTVNFDDLNSAELFHLALLIICDTNKLKCKNLYPLAEQIGASFALRDEVQTSRIKTILKRAKNQQKKIENTLTSLFNDDSELPASQMTVVTDIVKELKNITADLATNIPPQETKSKKTILEKSFNAIIAENCRLLDSASSFLKYHGEKKT